MSKRIVTSAIPDMTVAEVRRGLDFVRTQWRAQEDGTGQFRLSTELFNGMSVQEFCFKFTLGHHYKRHAKSKRGAEDGAEPAPRRTRSRRPSPTGKRKR
jgi:hypothetical protein